jgi:hypothetical protein
MSIDLNQDYSTIKAKLSAYQTVLENEKNENILSQARNGDAQDLDNKTITQSLSEFTSGSTKTLKTVKNQFEQLIDIFKYTLPSNQSSSYNSTLLRVFLLASIRTKERLLQILVEEVLSAIGCSQEQTFILNQPIYIKVESIDLFDQIKNSPETEPSSFMYEQTSTSPGTIPFAMNRAIYDRIQDEGVSFKADTGSNYIGASNSDIFDFEYVKQDNNGNIGNFLKVTLVKDTSSVKRISDFLMDYYQSIDILDFDVLSANLFQLITGFISISGDVSDDKQIDISKFQKILTRIMGLCFDDTQEIAVSGNAKLSELELLDQTFFEMSPLDLRNIDVELNNIRQGVVEFEDCDNVKLPVDVNSMNGLMRKIQGATTDSLKVKAVEDAANEIANNKDWKTLTLPKFNINATVKLDLIKALPRAIMSTVLSPKVVFGIMVASKSLGSVIGDEIDSLSTFLNRFKKFVINLMSRALSIYIEELFDLIKKNVKRLVGDILRNITIESKNKKIKMYSSIIYALYLLGSAFLDYRKCKSIVDEILKLLNLGLQSLGLGGINIPLPLLAGTALLPGVSDTRAFSNVIEQLQKSGLPTGDLPDGSPNLMNIGMFGMIKGMNQEQTENGKTDIFIPPLTITPAGVTVPARGWGKQM